MKLHRMSGRLLRCGLAALTMMAALAGCSRESPINSPYLSGALEENALYTAFVKRSPKYLDPASSYSTDETPYTYNIYEPLYGYHYLKRPYELIPRAASEVSQPVYLDAQGQPLPDDTPGERIAESVYDIKLRPGIRYQPHPAFARKPDGATPTIRWPRASWTTSSTFPTFPWPAAAN